jgi:hypothetical protein
MNSPLAFKIKYEIMITRISQGYVMSLLNLDLIEAIYSDAERELTNDELYREVQSRLSISDNDFNKKKNSVWPVCRITK